MQINISKNINTKIYSHTDEKDNQELKYAKEKRKND